MSEHRYNFNNVLSDLKTILYDDQDYLAEMLFNSIRDGFEKIQNHQELKSDSELLTIAVYQCLMNTFLSTFELVEALEGGEYAEET